MIGLNDSKVGWPESNVSRRSCSVLRATAAGLPASRRQRRLWERVTDHVFFFTCDCFPNHDECFYSLSLVRVGALVVVEQRTWWCHELKERGWLAGCLVCLLLSTCGQRLWNRVQPLLLAGRRKESKIPARTQSQPPDLWIIETYCFLYRERKRFSVVINHRVGPHRTGRIPPRRSPYWCVPYTRGRRETATLQTLAYETRWPLFTFYSFPYRTCTFEFFFNFTIHSSHRIRLLFVLPN